MLIDYHLHNHFSPDSNEDTGKIVERAIAMGMQDICITNHPELHDNESGKSTFYLTEATERFKLIKEELDEVQLEYPQIKIRFGVELEYVEERMDELTEFVESTPFDFVLGSVHIVNGVIIASRRFAHELYEKMSEEEAYNAYFDQMEKLIDWGNFDIAAHFDVFKKAGHSFYGPFDPEKYKNRIIPLLEAMKLKGIGLELNTKCLESKCNDIFPHELILKWALEVGIENFTLSSDAHKAKEVSLHIEKAAEIAKQVGIQQISTYQSRQVSLNELG